MSIEKLLARGRFIHPTTSRNLLFRLAIVIGSFLSVLLLVETVETYSYVERDLVREEAQREANRHATGIITAARMLRAHQSVELRPLLEEVANEYSQQIAWIRVIAWNGQTIVATDQAGEGPAYTAAQLRSMIDPPPAREWKSESGPVLVVMRPVRLGLLDNPKSPSAGSPEFIEMALYIKGISVNFGPLRQDLIVGLSAAVALLATVIVIGLRFGGYIRAMQLENELALARQVQFALFPAGDSVVPGAEFAARCIPSRQVGGDLYDAFSTANGETVFVLGDVSGKGLPAALLMGLVGGAVRASCAGEGISGCANSAEGLNSLLCAKTTRERFVTMFWCIFNATTGILRYVNAGHCPPVLVRNTGEIQRLETGGPVLGMLPAARYEYGEIAVEGGDLLVLFSDGIVEAARADEEEFGEERLLSVLGQNRYSTPTEICSGILASVEQFLGNTAAQDDQTLVVVRLQPSRPEQIPTAASEVVLALD